VCVLCVWCVFVVCVCVCGVVCVYAWCVCVCVMCVVWFVCMHGVCVEKREIKTEVLDPCLLILMTSVTESAEEADCFTFEWQRPQGPAVKLKAL